MSRLVLFKQKDLDLSWSENILQCRVLMVLQLSVNLRVGADLSAS